MSSLVRVKYLNEFEKQIDEIRGTTNPKLIIGADGNEDTAIITGIISYTMQCSVGCTVKTPEYTVIQAYQSLSEGDSLIIPGLLPGGFTFSRSFL